MKKILIAVLCLLVVAAVALGAMWYLGVFEKPVEEPDNRWTIRNLTVDMGEEEIAFGPEIRVSAVQETDEEGNALRNALHFELGLEGKALVPVTAEMVGKTVNFSVGNNGTVYSLDEETLAATMQEAMDGTADANSQKILDSVETMFGSMAAMVEMQNDKDFAQRQQKLTEGMMEAMLGVPGEDTEIEIEGKKYKGRRYAGEYSAESAISMMDYMRSCEEPAFAAYAQSVLDFTNVASSTEYASFAEMYADMLGEAGMSGAGEMEMVIAYDKNIIYEKASMTMDDGMGGKASVVAEEITRDGKTNVDMTMDMMGAKVTMTMESAENGFVMDMDFDQSSSSEVMGIKVESANKLQLDAVGAKAEGLWSAGLDAGFTMDVSYDFGEGPETESTSFTLNGTYAETMEEDKSITGAAMLSVNVGEADYGLSFDINRGKDAAIAPLAAEGVQVQQLVLDDAEAPVYDLLEADVIGLLGDVSLLASDPGIARAVEMVTSLIMPVGMTEETYSEDLILGDDTEAYSYEGYTDVTSFEEAAQIYLGKMPQYTAPEGYELLGISVSEYDFIAGYSNGEKTFQFSVMTLGDDTGMESEAITAESYEFYQEGDLVYEAYAFDGLTVVDFGFEGVSMEEAVAMINGLAL